MSLIAFESSDDNSRDNKKQSWFRRQQQSLFSSRRANRKQKKKNSELKHSSDADVLSNISAESIKISKIQEKKKLKNSDENISVNSTDLLECPLCLCNQSQDLFQALSSCRHKCCTSCMRRYLAIEITENRINLTCPECPEKLAPSDVQTILKDEPQLLVKWEEFALRRALSADPDCRWCPAPDCGYAVIAYGCASCPRLSCQRPDCKTEFCYHCRQVWHHNQTCDSARLQRSNQLRRSSNSASLSRAEEIKPCPKCGALIVKANDGSCNHMTCTVCEAEFCWLCLQEISDLHYLSPSGCTFWGKKQWSRKKQILWQLGLLVGAPLGIGLVAGIALPVITFGLPVLIARKIRSKCDFLGLKKRNRNALVVGGVLLTIPFSPVIAALAVGLGVPILLLYVYCVVPFSLCRNGTYGMRNQMRTGSAGGGLNLPSAFRLDIAGAAGARPSASHEESFRINERTNRLLPTNPSIGEASVGGLTTGSLNISHASNLDKVSRSELDGASMRALAGTSITGSTSGMNAGVVTNRTESRLKEHDQASIQTYLSSNSGSGVTAVQVHVSDCPPEHNLSFNLTGNLKRSYSTVSSGAKRKTQFSKKSSGKVPSTDEIEPSSDNMSRDVSPATTSESPSPLTIVDECQMMLVKNQIDDVTPSAMHSAHCSSLDNGSCLLINKLQDGDADSALL